MDKDVRKAPLPIRARACYPAAESIGGLIAKAEEEGGLCSFVALGNTEASNEDLLCEHH